jgi:hypothetical protein
MPNFPQKEPHAAPYCTDPNCVYCKELKEAQEAIRMHQPLPKKQSGVA